MELATLQDQYQESIHTLYKGDSSHIQQLTEIQANKTLLEQQQQQLVSELQDLYKQCETIQHELHILHIQYDEVIQENLKYKLQIELLKLSSNKESSISHLSISQEENEFKKYVPEWANPVGYNSMSYESNESNSNSLLQLKQELQQCQDTLHLYRLLNEELRNMQSNLKTKLWETEDRYTLILSSKSTGLSTLQEMELLRKEKEDLVMELSSCQTQLRTGVVARMQVIQSSYNELKIKYSEMIQQKDSLSHSNVLLSREITSLKRDIQQNKIDKIEYQQLYQSSEEKRNQLEAVLMIANEECVEYNMKIEFQDNEIKEASRAIACLTLEIETLHNEIELKNNECTDMSLLVTSLQQQVVDYKHTLDTLQRLHTSLESKYDTSTQQIHELNQQIELNKSINSERDEIELDLTISLLMVMEEYSNVYANIDYQSNQRLMLIACIEAIESELEEKKKIIVSYENDIKLLRSKVII
jgi:chromosome segregation ATPase